MKYYCNNIYNCKLLKIDYVSYCIYITKNK